MSSACTSTVFKHGDRNLHYRTMDWEMDHLRDLTVEVDFVKDNVLIYKGVTWVGYVGLMTGISSERYSVALNYRRSDGSILGNLCRTLSQKWPVGYIIRDIMEEKCNRKQAESILTNAKLISPCYITLCHEDKSCVIIRDPDECVDKYHGDTLVQTNIDPECYDENKDILWSIERRDKVNNIIANDIQKCQTDDDIFNTFNVFPVSNPTTIYTTLMDPNIMDLKVFIFEK